METGDATAASANDQPRRNDTASGNKQLKMGFCGRPGRCLNVLLILLVFAAATAVVSAKTAVEDVPAGDVPDIAELQAATCRPIDPCRGTVANQVCCKAINAAILSEGGCGCVCKVLKSYGAPKLPAACAKGLTCSKCASCLCS